MGSSTHLPGVGLRPGLIGRRTLAEILESNRQRTADTRWAQMVRSIGGGLHLVKDFCNDQEYIVGSAQGSLSYRPGQVVALMSSTGTPGEVIVAQPPPGRAGASAFPVSLGTRSTRFAVTAPEPAALIGHTYLGLFFENHPTDGTWRIRAWLYDDGAFVQEIRVSAYQSSALGSFAAMRAWQRVHSLGDVIVWTQDYAVPAFGYWNTASSTTGGNSATEEPVSYPAFVGDALWPGSGEHVYFHASNGNYVQLHRLLLTRIDEGELSTFDHAETWMSANQMTDANLFPSPAPICATGGDFQVPTQDSVTEEIACPYRTLAGVWANGRGRMLVNPDSPSALSCGWPVSGTRSARLTAFVTGEQTIGLLSVGPTSPELALLPASWGLADVGGLSVSTSGTELAVYPATLAEDGVGEGADKLLRLEARTTAYPAVPSVGRLTIQPGPNDQLPHVMLCRD